MKVLSSLILLLALTGCESDPYPSVGKKYKGPAEETKDPADALSMTLSGQYEFYEGKITDFRIRAEAPAPYAPIIKVEGLPAGAKFDEEKFVFSWEPGYFDGNLPGDPTIKTRTYPITVWLSSTKPDSEKRTKEVVLIVNDVPLDLNINGGDTKSVREGDELIYDFSIENKDYPNGPFAVTTEGFPANTRIEQLSDTDFRLTFKPDFHHVIINENSNCSTWSVNCIEYDGTINVYNPAKHANSKKVKFQVNDVRRKPKIVAPKPMSQGLDITFQVSGYDLNGEVAPKISRLGSAPDYGKFSTQIVPDEKNNSSVLNVTWKDIPPSYAGKSHTFRFQTCALDYRKNYSNCTSATTTVTIEVKDRNPPSISRSDWAPGEIKYLDFNSRKSFDIYVRDGDNRNEVVRDVKIMPEHMRKYVSWRNNTLQVRFDKPGIHQFSLVAKSEYNVTSAESFVAEVFQKDRSRILYFTDSTRDPEVKFFKEVMGDVTLFNPVLQALNDRNLSGRDTLILGTGILTDPEMKSNIADAMKNIENVVVASAMIENMPDKFINELQQEHHISILGRYNELPNLPKLSDTYFIARDDFETTNAKVTLKTTSSIESSNPLIFSVGVDRVGCEDVLDLTDKKEEARLKVGIICDRKGGGRYAILGTEFADLKVEESDAQIPTKWLHRMLNTTLNNKEVQ